MAMNTLQYMKRPDTKKEFISNKSNTNFSKLIQSPLNDITQLQRAIGNQAVQRLLQSGALQAKLTVSKPGDKYEQEADRVADAVMRMPEPQVQRDCTFNGEYSKYLAKQLGRNHKLLQTRPVRANNDEEMTAPPIVHEVLRSHGQQLDPDTIAFFKQRFGHNFSQVRVHTGTVATAAAHVINAKAFTVGRNIVFEHGQYSPKGDEGRKLLAHELVHVVQQDAMGRSPSGRFGNASSKVQRTPAVPAAVIAALAAAGRHLLACIIGAAFGVGLDYVIQRGMAWWQNQRFRWNTCMAFVSGIIGCVSAGVGSAISRAIFRYTGGHLERDFATKAAVWVITWIYGRFPIVPIAIILKWLVGRGCMEASELPPGVQTD